MLLSQVSHFGVQVAHQDNNILLFDAFQCAGQLAIKVILILPISRLSWGVALNYRNFPCWRVKTGDDDPIRDWAPVDKAPLGSTGQKESDSVFVDVIFILAAGVEECGAIRCPDFSKGVPPYFADT